MSRKRARPSAKKKLAQLRRRMFLMDALSYGRWLHYAAIIIWKGERISYLECKKKLTTRQLHYATAK